VIEVERMPDGTAQAVADVAVGIVERRVEVPLGSLTGQVDPGGLMNLPVVVVASAGSDEAARRGARAAGGAAIVGLRSGAEPVGGRLLEAVGADVVIAVVEPAEAPGVLVTARALSGRPLPVIPFDDPERASAMLDGCWVDLDIAIPSVDDPLRGGLRRRAEELGLFAAHHVVEVDPRPGLDGPEGPPRSLDVLAAAATGVLAGRIAAGNRRWR
jgi:hypothetical protein